MPEPGKLAEGARGSPGRGGPEAPTRPAGWLLSFARSRPLLAVFLLVSLSNVLGSYFNIEYNRHLVVEYYFSPAQVEFFWSTLVPAYNVAAYSLGFGLIWYFFRPVIRAQRDLRRGSEIGADRLAFCRRRVVNLPFIQVVWNLVGWMPGAVVFPLAICSFEECRNPVSIWMHFGISFSISALLTSIQTFFLVEEFLISVLYRDLFQGSRPADLEGTVRVRLKARILLLWSSVAVAPLVALVVVAFNFTEDRLDQFAHLHSLSAGVAIVGLPISGFLMWMVARNIIRWVDAHAVATGRIGRGDFAVRIAEQRPDEWGHLTDRFNDMAAALERGEYVRETFGQFVNAEVREEILHHHRGLGGSIRTVTVLFADLRGFTRRSCRESPDQVVEILNRFLGLAVAAVEGGGGWINKFLGDGILALFGAPRERPDHARLAVDAAAGLLDRLARLNAELETEGREILRVGIGIHTGPALVGCIGASVSAGDGTRRVRREFTAIGETVNVAQRLEQLTKRLGGPILASESTVSALRGDLDAACLGPVELPGVDEPVVVYRLDGASPSRRSPQEPPRAVGANAL